MPSSTTTGLPAPPLGAPAEFEAPASWRCIDFISDLHLSEATPRTTEAWASYLRDTEADAVFMLGDLFETWVGDDARHEGFERHCTQVLLDASRRRSLAFMAGNRDFLLGADMLQASGVVGLADPTLLTALGQRVLLTHGDSLCLADTDYQRFRGVVRNPLWQQDFLAKPLDERRRFARGLRDQSEAHKQDNPLPLAWTDVDPAAAVSWLHSCKAPTLVHGHTHRPGSGPLAEGVTRHVLSDWNLDEAPYRAEVLRMTADAFIRLDLVGAARRPR
ncbi:MAG TPA: UDP-2,3-diacylglucosamine diphosphatase [Rhizobacter sp.]|nr:UDP-2,3-diacylglucosamine diphosphatase [Rhizobacter sp.]